MSWMLVIPGIAVGLSLLSIFIEFLMHDREKGKKLEFSIKRKQREIKQLQKEDPKAAMAANKELMSLMGQNFKLRMKSMLISFPLFILIFFFLHGMMAVAPLTAGEVSQVGVDMRNLDASPQTVNIELVSSDVQVTGENSRQFELDDKGDEGDKEQVWWNVTAPEGSRQYSVKVAAGGESDEAAYGVEFVPAGSLTAGFEPGETEKLLGESVEVKPLYKGIEISLFGMTLPWIFYYIISYFIVTIVLSPVKNRILWGHWGGIKHLERLDREKNEAAKE